VALSEVVLADLLTQTGEYNEALQLYQKALGVQVQLAGSQSFVVADLLHKVGEVFCIQGRYQDALLVKQQALGAFAPLQPHCIMHHPHL
jgi:tetratricopeptide (TPR) repeat protein